MHDKVLGGYFVRLHPRALMDHPWIFGISEACRLPKNPDVFLELMPGHFLEPGDSCSPWTVRAVSVSSPVYHHRVRVSQYQID